mgnify:CR=1 FL=1
MILFWLAPWILSIWKTGVLCRCHWWEKTIWFLTFVRETIIQLLSNTFSWHCIGVSSTCNGFFVQERCEGDVQNKVWNLSYSVSYKSCPPKVAIHYEFFLYACFDSGSPKICWMHRMHLSLKCLRDWYLYLNMIAHSLLKTLNLPSLLFKFIKGKAGVHV